MVRSQLTADPWFQAILPASASWVAEIIGTRHQAQLIFGHYAWLFVFLEETGFHCDGQAGLKLLTSSDLAALASQNAGITGVNHCAQPGCLLICFSLFSVNW